MSEIPETRYARSGEAHIAYQVSGEGAHDLVFIPPALSHLDLRWEEPSYASASAPAWFVCAGHQPRQAWVGTVRSRGRTAKPRAAGS